METTNKTDLQAFTLVGPTNEDTVLDPIAVLHLDNRLSCVPFQLFQLKPICNKFNVLRFGHGEAILALASPRSWHQGEGEA